MKYIKKALKYIENKELYPKIRIIEGCPTNIFIKINNKKIISFCSNDYLGLANKDILKKAAHNAIDKYGIGSGGSRLISGNTDIQIELEKTVAQYKKQNDAITFATGYMVNSGVIPAIMNATRFFKFSIKGNILFSDEYNHASIIDGCRLSDAKIVKYKHKDTRDLEKKLKKYRKYRKMIVTDGIFSMDGDIAPLPEIVKLAKQYDAITMVDDAHASGVLGKEGRGTAEYFNIDPGEIDLIMGTFTKAFGGIGGFIAGNKDMIKYLRVNTRTYIFTAPIPPMICASLISSIKESIVNPSLRKQLWENVEYLKENLLRLNCNLLSTESQIIPIYIGNEKKCEKISNFLFTRGILIPCVRWPAVPWGSARLRLTVKASHTKQQMNKLVNILKKII